MNYIGSCYLHFPRVQYSPEKENLGTTARRTPGGSDTTTTPSSLESYNRSEKVPADRINPSASSAGNFRGQVEEGVSTDVARHDGEKFKSVFGEEVELLSRFPFSGEYDGTMCVDFICVVLLEGLFQGYI